MVDDLVENYNKIKHKTLGITPTEAWTGEKQPKKLKPVATPFKVGDTARFLLSSQRFNKKSQEPRWSKQHYIISEIVGGNHKLHHPDTEEQLASAKKAWELLKVTQSVNAPEPDADQTEEEKEQAEKAVAHDRLRKRVKRSAQLDIDNPPRPRRRKRRAPKARAATFSSIKVGDVFVIRMPAGKRDVIALDPPDERTGDVLVVVKKDGQTLRIPDANLQQKKRTIRASDKMAKKTRERLRAKKILP